MRNIWEVVGRGGTLTLVALWHAAPLGAGVHLLWLGYWGLAAYCFAYYLERKIYHRSGERLSD